MSRAGLPGVREIYYRVTTLIRPRKLYVRPVESYGTLLGAY